MKAEADKLRNSIQYGLGVMDSGSGEFKELSNKIDELFELSYLEGQSNPNIKQLEWVEVNSLGEIGENGIKAKTSFGDYEVYVKSDHDGYVLWCLEKNLHIFDTEMQSKMYAQTDFERRVMGCLDI